MTPENEKALAKPAAPAMRAMLGNRSIVLIGMMGCGKSSVGRRLAAALDLPFNDADVAIEHAAGMTIEEIFEVHGEPYFREGEERVIRRLLQSGPQVLATGGGAVISEKTRAEICKNGISIWLNAPVELLLQRVSRRDNRPLLKTSDAKAVLTKLLIERKPFYASADIVFESRDAPHETIVDEMIALLESYLSGRHQAPPREVAGSPGAIGGSDDRQLSH
ncbi:MAG: shikimate kinase [Rhodomicrobium sp.]